MRDVLESIMKAETVWCDRWAVTITPLSEDEKDTNGEGGNVRHIISNNYFSIGIDAKVALDFHLARQADPDSFKSRKMNKIKYFGYGTSAVFDGTCRGVPPYPSPPSFLLTRCVLHINRSGDQTPTCCG